jgi:hypothetical protein
MPSEEPSRPPGRPDRQSLNPDEHIPGSDLDGTRNRPGWDPDTRVSETEPPGESVPAGQRPNLRVYTGAQKPATNRLRPGFARNGTEEPKTRARKRKPRVTLSPEDARVPRWIGEQGQARSDVVALLLGRGRGEGPAPRSTTWDHLERWERAGLVFVDPDRRALWVALTKLGMEKVGLPYTARRPSMWHVEHTYAIARVRLELERQGLQWIGEPALRVEYARLQVAGITPGNVDGYNHRTGRLWHRPDGAVPLGRYSDEYGLLLRAVEVELSAKSAAAYTDDLLRLHPAIQEVVYMTRPEQAERVAGLLRRANMPPEPRALGLGRVDVEITVEALPANAIL